MPTHAIPVFPANLGLIYYRYGYHDRRYFNYFYIHGPTVLAPGWTFAGWWGSAYNWFSVCFPQILPTDFNESDAWFFYNDGITTHSNGPISYLLPIFGAHCITPALCPCWTRRSTLGLPAGNGRVFGPAFQKGTLDGDRINNPNLSVLRNIGVLLGTQFAYNTQLYTPCMYSPSTGIISSPIVYKIVERPSYVYRRRAGDRPNTAYSYPIVP